MRTFFLFVTVLCLQGSLVVSAFPNDGTIAIVEDGKIADVKIQNFSDMVLRAIKKTGSGSKTKRAQGFIELGDITISDLLNFNLARNYYERASDELKASKSKKSREIQKRIEDKIRASFEHEFLFWKENSFPSEAEFYFLLRFYANLISKSPEQKPSYRVQDDWHFKADDIIKGHLLLFRKRSSSDYYRVDSVLLCIPKRDIDTVKYVHKGERLLDRPVQETTDIYLIHHNEKVQRKSLIEKINIYKELREHLSEDYQAKASTEIDNLLIKIARKRGTVETYKSAISQSYGNTHHEEAFFKLVELSPSLETCQEYRTRYPEGKYSEEVDLAYSATVNTVESFSTYLEKYPAGKPYLSGWVWTLGEMKLKYNSSRSYPQPGGRYDFIKTDSAFEASLGNRSTDFGQTPTPVV